MEGGDSSWKFKNIKQMRKMKSKEDIPNANFQQTSVGGSNQIYLEEILHTKWDDRKAENDLEQIYICDNI